LAARHELAMRRDFLTQRVLGATRQLPCTPAAVHGDCLSGVEDSPVRRPRHLVASPV